GKDSNIPKKTKLVIYPPYVKTHIPLPNGQGSQKVILSHYPIFSFDSCGFDAIHLYGHIHNFYEQIEDYHNALDKSTFSYSNDKVAKPKAYNVGCMNPWMNYTPKSLYEIQATFSGEAVYDTLVSVNDYWEFYRKNNIYYWEKHSAKEQNRIMLEWKELAKDDSFFAEMLKDFRKNVMGVEE
ncbi:MAG: hypothetical protein HUJ68_04120, partial [Clostridia bacterium]|nr:hypothetical protein [Clostridia bacterium]